MTKNSKTNEYAKNIGLTIVGGVGLFIATAVLNSMFSAPVSRADFDTHKAESTRHLKNIEGTLNDIKAGQSRIIEHLLKDGKR